MEVRDSKDLLFPHPSSSFRRQCPLNLSAVVSPPPFRTAGRGRRKEGGGWQKKSSRQAVQRTTSVGDVERALERQMEPPSSSPSSKAASSSQLDPPSLCNLGPNYPPTTQSAAINAKYPSFPFYLWRPRPPPRRSESKPSHLPPLCIILTT